jgi:hypothetical protein
MLKHILKLLQASHILLFLTLLAKSRTFQNDSEFTSFLQDFFLFSNAVHFCYVTVESRIFENSVQLQTDPLICGIQTNVLWKS